MKPSEQMTITLPVELAKRIRSKVSEGQFEDESELIAQSLLEFVDNESGQPSWMSETEFDAWLRAEALPVLEAMQADPSRGLTAEQVRAHLELQHENFRKAG